MKIIKEIKNLKIKKSVVAIGTYDGLHKAHQKIISTASKISKLKRIPFILFTFSNIPREYINKKPIEKINTEEKKIELLKKYKVDYLIEIEFNDKIRYMKAEEFLENVLIKKFKAKYIVVGFNFKFGFNKKGNILTLKKYQKKHNYKLLIIRKIKCKHIVISSTIIRKLLKKGKVEEARIYLGYAPFINGKIIKGKGLGKKLGFPTINLLTEKNMIIKDGVYATITKINNELYKSVSSLGKNLTFNENEKKLETHILNFNKNIYNKKVSIYFIKRIRNIKKFQNEKELIEAIKEDIKKAKKILKKKGVNR